MQLIGKARLQTLRDDVNYQQNAYAIPTILLRRQSDPLSDQLPGGGQQRDRRHRHRTDRRRDLCRRTGQPRAIRADRRMANRQAWLRLILLFQ